MNLHMRAFVLAALLLGAVGCRAQHLRRDQDEFRAALLSMETNQIMDNLVRAKQGFPILQIDYGGISGTVTDSGAADIQGSYSDIVAGPITRFISGSAEARHQQQMTVQGEPVRNLPEVYLAYLQYLNLRDGLLVSTECPPECAAHIWRQGCDGLYYWIPIERRGDFFDLAMRVTVLRGQPPKAPDAFEISVAEVTDYIPKLEPGGIPEPGTAFQLTLKLDPPLESNDSGSANLTIDEVVYPVQILRNDAVGGGETTKELRLVYVFGSDTTERQIPVDPRAMKDKLRNAKLPFFASRFRPEPPSQAKLLEEIRTQLNLIRLDQIRE